MEEKKYILFDKYLNNELTAEEKNSFEEELSTDLNLKNEFDLYTEVEHSLGTKFENAKQEAALKETLTSLGNKYIQAKTEPKSKVIPLFKYRKLMVAASIALLIGFFVFNPSKPSYSDFANYPTLQLVERSENSTALQKAEEAFNNKNYKTAFAQFTILEEQFPKDIELQLYKGVCLVELEKYSQAETIFTTIISGNSAFKNTAKWYQALSLLKQEQFEASKAMLQTITEDAEEFEQAQKLLRKL
jgi:hypothetical protein